MPRFATYLHDATCQGNRPYGDIDFAGHAVPYFNGLRTTLAQHLTAYEQLPLRKADLDDFLTVHDAKYLDKIQRMAVDEPLDDLPQMSMECRGYEYFLDAYCFGLGGLYQAVDAMRAGRLDRAYTFALGGHHAFRARGHGYCLLNPMAAAVRYAQRQGFTNVLIVDWDFHHGDGTQSLFEHDSSVYHISIHNLVDLYMAVQRVLRLGTTTHAAAIGHCNIPLLPTYFPDTIMAKFDFENTFFRPETSLTAFQDALETTPFAPDLIFIFAGYDSHGDDLGQAITDWTNADFQTLTRMVLKRSADCPVISVHGGGYKPHVTIPAALAHIETLVND